MTVGQFYNATQNSAPGTALTIEQIYNNTDGTVTLNSAGTGLTLQEGNYIVEYHANATDITDSATLAAYVTDSQIPQTVSTATASATASVVPLSGKSVISVPTDGITLDFRNGGTNAFTVTNLSVTINPL